MSDDKLKEYYGTQRRSFAGGPTAGSNFYHGADLGTFSKARLGTRGADSNFSRRTQILVPEDYFDVMEEENEETEEDMGEDYVVKDSKYSLAEAVLIAEQVIDMVADPDDDNVFNVAARRVLSDPTELARFEKSVGEYAYELGSEVVLRDLSSSTGIGDEIIGFLRILINIFIQIRSSNNEMDKQEEIVEKYLESLRARQSEIRSSQESVEREIILMQSHIKKLQEIQSDLYRDISDTVQGAIALYPDLVVDPSAFGESIAGKGAEFLPELFQKLEIDSMSDLELAVQREPELKSLKHTIAFLSTLKGLSNFLPLGGPGNIIGVALSLLNINIFNPNKIMISGIRSVFVSAQLQNKLLFAIQVLKSDVPDIALDDDFTAAQPEYYESSEEPESRDSGSEFFRRLFISKPGDERFDESLEKRNMSYILEAYEEDEKDTEDLLKGAEEDEKSDEIEEFSGAAAGGGGPALPLGMSTKGSRGKKSGDHGGKPFPYTKDVMDKFYDYAQKSFGGK